MTDETPTPQECPCEPKTRVLPDAEHDANCGKFRAALKRRMMEQDPRRAEGKQPPRERKPL